MVVSSSGWRSHQMGVDLQKVMQELHTWKNPSLKKFYFCVQCKKKITSCHILVVPVVIPYLNCGFQLHCFFYSRVSQCLIPLKDDRDEQEEALATLPVHFKLAQSTQNNPSLQTLRREDALTASMVKSPFHPLKTPYVAQFERRGELFGAQSSFNRK